MPSVYCDVFNIMDATFFCTVREKTLKADPVITLESMIDESKCSLHRLDYDDRITGAPGSEQYSLI